MSEIKKAIVTALIGEPGKLADGMLTLEKIAEYAGLPLDEVKKLNVERTA